MANPFKLKGKIGSLAALLLLFTLALIGAAGCSSAEPSPVHETGVGHELDADHPHEKTPLAVAREVALTASEWEFMPVSITVRKGEPVTLVLVNDGIIEHDVEIAAFGLHLHTPPGGSLKGSFVPDKAGTFEFACEIPGHRAAGMVGQIVVTE